MCYTWGIPQHILDYIVEDYVKKLIVKCNYGNLLYREWKGEKILNIFSFIIKNYF